MHGMFNCRSACVPQLSIKIVGVLLNHSVSLRFVQTLWVAFQAKISIRRSPTSSAPTKSHTEAITNIPQIVTYAVVEKEMENKG